ncbi:hypothetical protein RAAC3_TM7C00001G0176 [Candidatus Saccharibacteria bacterium RAAC3_TM7_1]|nr:hypothetical protein RAAC3_TM7C00001G0176 [Candidatus Saccharibacteria bacterium RAAC3_TM7_1]HCZ28785.1 prepilin-type cleavage/methylation domain-containing protein [Candidatus Saccharibacteria bacterium]
MKRRGFTVIELLVAIVLLTIIGTVFWYQKNNIEVAGRDDKRKIAVNAMYYGLEEVYYKQHGYYPQKVEKNTLASVDNSLLKDPRGTTIGSADSDYRYEAKNCTDTKCKSYTLRTILENEADYVKNSRHQ